MFSMFISTERLISTAFIALNVCLCMSVQSKVGAVTTNVKRVTVNISKATSNIAMTYVKPRINVLDSLRTAMGRETKTVFKPKTRTVNASTVTVTGSNRMSKPKTNTVNLSRPKPTPDESFNGGTRTIRLTNKEGFEPIEDVGTTQTTTRRLSTAQSLRLASAADSLAGKVSPVGGTTTAALDEPPSVWNSSCPVNEAWTAYPPSPRGRLQWDERHCPDSCKARSCEFLLSAPPGFVIVLAFQRVELFFQPGDNYENDVSEYDAESLLKADGLFVRAACLHSPYFTCGSPRAFMVMVWGRQMLGPMWTHEQHLVAQLPFIHHSDKDLSLAARTPSPSGPYRRPSSSRFTLTYTTHPDPPKSGSRCSAIGDVPESLRCDMVVIADCLIQNTNRAYFDPPTDPTNSPTDSAHPLPLTDPTHTPTDPAHSPTDLAHPPANPAHSPTDSAHPLPPTDPTHSPTDPAHSPTDPAHHPADPAHSPTNSAHPIPPTDHTHSHTDPAHSPIDPNHSPTDSSHSVPLTDPAHSPADLAHSPTDPGHFIPPTDPGHSIPPTDPAHSGPSIPYAYLDEMDCAYEDAGCGRGLVPWGDECLLLNPDISCLLFSLDHAAFPDPRLAVFVARKVARSGKSRVLMGLERMSVSGPAWLGRQLYRYQWWWPARQTALHNPGLELYGQLDGRCSALYVDLVGHVTFRAVRCRLTRHGNFMQACHTYNRHRQHTYRSTKIRLAPTSWPPDAFPTKACPGEWHVHPFHPCSVFLPADPRALSALSLPVFRCGDSGRVHYTLLCDGHADCADRSDELGCGSVWRQVEGGPLEALWFLCQRSLELVRAALRCDGMEDCVDGSDEERCVRCRQSTLGPLLHQKFFSTCVHPFREGGGSVNNVSYTLRRLRQTDVARMGFSVEGFTRRPLLTDLRPWRLELDGYGGSYFRPLAGPDCPETHVRCPGAYCIPSHMVNNGVHDCPHLHADDEFVDAGFSCPGFYRCYRSHVCLHNVYLCDGVHHCPLKDDERFCDVKRTCPDGCVCEGFALTCHDMVDALRFSHVRYLDVSGSLQPDLADIHLMVLLQFLNLSRCSLSALTLTRMHHLKVLDLSGNRFRSLGSLDLRNMTALQHIDLSHNRGLMSNHIPVKSFLQGLNSANNLRTLILKNTGLLSIEPKTYEDATSLRNLDVTANQLTITETSSLAGLGALDVLRGDDQRLCCIHGERFPGSKVACHAPRDELSSCSDLLRSPYSRLGLWLLAVLAVSGNGGVLVYRLCLEQRGSAPVHRLLVANLALSDLAMGLYLTLIGAADLHYRGRYLWRQTDWTSSAACRLAGFLALVSCEVSSFLIGLITLDRLLVVRFPLSPRLHLARRSAQGCCGALWGAGVLLAAAPLLPLARGWRFYGQTGICLPLPVTRRQFPGRHYAFGVLVVLNLALFVLTGLGQLSVYLAVRTRPLTAATSTATEAGRAERRQKEAAIARRLLLIVMTDFCCWVPVGALGVLASRGFPVPGGVSVWAAALLLPLNSALNPFLYTLNVLLQRRAKRTERRRIQALVTSLQNDVTLWPLEKLEKLFHGVLTSRRADVGLSPELLARICVHWSSEKIDALLLALGGLKRERETR